VDFLSSVFTWLGEREAGISAAVGIAAVIALATPATGGEYHYDRYDEEAEAREILADERLSADLRAGVKLEELFGKDELRALERGIRDWIRPGRPTD